ncbi:MAG: T9SS type A sorting domain-containing protein [Flavobacteriales bacterium]
MKFTLRNAVACALLFATSFPAISQVSHGGQPSRWSDSNFSVSGIPVVSTPSLDFEALQAEDAVVDQYKEAPYRFGVEVETNYSFENSGQWVIDPNSDFAVWILGVECPEAQNISFVFSQFNIPEGAKLFVWNDDRTQYLGSFDYTNASSENSLAIGLIEDDKVFIEYQVPYDSKHWGNIELGQIIHGYRSVVRTDLIEDVDRGPFGNSGNCNINVNCPEGLDWQIEKKSVALIVSGGSALCSGSLVNNTAQDGTPYFLTANHCLGGNVNNWVFYFNHESATCNGSSGPTNQSISGATLRASNAYSDFALLELNATPPADFNVQYSGWDRSDEESAVSSAVGIHHPSGDVKKICFEDNAPYHSAQAGAQVWFIDQWELGVTEGGSSGSPLFNQDHRIIGQLYGGWAACSGSVNNGQADYYGRFGQSWDHGTTDATRLSNWLDPLGTGQITLDGYPEGFVAAEFDAAAMGISGIAAMECATDGTPSFTLRNQGTETLVSCLIEISYNGVAQSPIDWSGSLMQGQQEVIYLPSMTFVDGENNVQIVVSSPNGVEDAVDINNTTSFTFIAAIGETADLNIEITFDNYPEETSWEVTNDQGVVIVSSGGTYSSQADQSTINLTYCMPIGCYTFTIFDEYGDGMCASGWTGNVCGSYSVTDAAGNVLAWGDESNNFTDEVSTDFCLVVDPTQVSELKSEGKIEIYPNPASNAVTVKSNDKVTSIQILDITGKVVKAQTNQQLSVFDVSDLSEGCYFIRVASENAVKTQKLIIKK